MRSSVMGSGVVHVMLLVLLVIVRGPMAHIVPGPEVVQVALIDPAAVAPPAPAPVVAPPKEIKPVDVKPDEEIGVKIEPAKPKKAKPEKPRPAEHPPAPPMALPTARLGAGLSGDVTVDASNFEFTYYLVLVRNRIASNWTPPTGLATGGNPVRSVVYFRIGRGGDVTGIRLETGSGAEFFDRAALRSVVLSDPMPPLPLGFAAGDLGVHFGFEWESP